MAERDHGLGATLRFVDEAAARPVSGLAHEHVFTEEPGGTVVRDQVRYVVPGGRWIDRLFVRRDLERIFGFRRQKLWALLVGRRGEGSRRVIEYATQSRPGARLDS